LPLRDRLTQPHGFKSVKHLPDLRLPKAALMPKGEVTVIQRGSLKMAA
jgi:hypothetical protein